MTCPYCAEQIQDAVKKCRFCGEWLEGHGPLDASHNARAVAKGIKKQKLDEQSAGCFTLLMLIIGIAVGAKIGGSVGVWVGIIIFVAGAIFAGMRYQKE